MNTLDEPRFMRLCEDFRETCEKFPDEAVMHYIQIGRQCDNEQIGRLKTIFNAYDIEAAQTAPAGDTP